MSATIIRGDARALPLPDESVDLIVTSPPYFGLRDYRDGDASLAGQIGAESTPREYVAALLECTAEWMRILKPSGSLWVNLGDSYYSGKGAPGRTTVDAKSEARSARRAGGNPLDGPSFGVGKKSLVGLPWRYALGCIDDLDLILRAEVIWSKPNGLPESVTDRVRRSHEQWFHLVKSPQYFSAVDEIREEHKRAWGGTPNGGHTYAAMKAPGAKDSHLGGAVPNPLGKLPGSVWDIATQPLKVPAHLEVDHFAAFPMALPRRIILGWSPSGICTVCDEGRRPISARTLTNDRGGTKDQRSRGVPLPPTVIGTLGFEREVRITGYACACPTPDAPSMPAVVLDPFSGTGTTVLVAKALGRIGIGVDRSFDYCRLAAWRTTDPSERARALGVPRPPKPMDGQGDLFEVAS